MTLAVRWSLAIKTTSIFYTFLNLLYRFNFFLIIITTNWFLILPAYAQELNDPIIQKKAGRVEYVVGASEFNIEFTYEDIRIAQFDSEDDFIQYKLGKLESNNAGSAEEWLLEWKNAKDSVFKEEFVVTLNKVLDKKSRKIAKQLHARYTIIVKTKYIEPPTFSFQLNSPAICHFEFDFIETTLPEKMLLQLYLPNVWNRKAMGYDITIGRIAGCYSKAGKILGKYLIQYMQ